MQEKIVSQMTPYSLDSALLGMHQVEITTINATVGGVCVCSIWKSARAEEEFFRVSLLSVVVRFISNVM